MKFYSTKNNTYEASLQEAVLQGLAPDGGLFVPKMLPVIRPEWVENLSAYSFPEIAFALSTAFFADDIPTTVLENIVREAYDFPIPLVQLNNNLHILELFHGPTLAFKDVAARFMSRIMQYYVQQSSQELTIIVATSGDTGSAVASGFLGIQGINVVILYPSGRVSHLQEQQLTTMGGNITALEVQGSFDDCQALVKQALNDPEIIQKIQLGSANSINIARLLPQTFYYFYAYAQLKSKHTPIVMSVPSGNFGNLTAGLIAKRMGLPIDKFIAATNINDVVPQYLQTGKFNPRASQTTISNAMDVGDPSNFSRMLELYNHDLEAMQKDITGFSFTDEQTRQAMQEISQQYTYIMDPHGAVAYLGIKQYNNYKQGIILETAHPAKFLDIVESTVNMKLEIPKRLQKYLHKPKKSKILANNFSDFKHHLLSNY